jgi:hypothetical protein
VPLKGDYQHRLGLVVGAVVRREDTLVGDIVCYRVDTLGKVLKV